MGTLKRTFEPKPEPLPDELVFRTDTLQGLNGSTADSRLLDFPRGSAESEGQIADSRWEENTPAVEEECESSIDEAFFANLEKLRRSAQALRDYSETLRVRYGEPTTAPHDPKPNHEDTEPFSRLNGKGIIDTTFDFVVQIFKQPRTFARRYANFAGEMLQIVQANSTLKPQRGDRRFRDAVWQDNPFYHMVLQTYLAWDKEVKGLIEDLNFEDERDRTRAQFLFNQLSAAMAPSNSPFNPVAVKRAYQTGGKSIFDGLQNIARDVKTNHGMPRQITEDAYQVGKNLGISPGAVVYRCKLFELIQYTCGEQNLVHKRPLLVVPPQINKFYVFDLSPKNSIVEYLRKNGMQVFMVSWKNPTKTDANAGLESYIEELDKGVQAILDITGSPDLNLVSACAGGITATCLQAFYASQGKSAICNHTLLVTALDVDGHPTLDLFMNKRTVASFLARSRRRGVMDGKELAHVFAWLRPTDLVWNYWVNNNLLGKEPPNMDVLYWDNDSTRLPATLHRDFVDIFLNNRFAEGTLSLGNRMLDLGKIEGDFYFLAGNEDYLMPWKNCYYNPTLFAKAGSRFVLSNSGHIQSVLRPPNIGNSIYFTNEQFADSPEGWLESAKKHKGSWWEDWSEWLSSRSASLMKAPQVLGSERYPPICPSPGTYVLEK
jgi:polyhydroxyalkanoate synthase subunit PhaC